MGARKAKRRKGAGMAVRCAILACMAAGAAGWLLYRHARWLEEGPKDARFVRFMRRYARSAAGDALPARGVATDRNGAELEAAPEGSAFARAVDALSLGREGGRVRLTLDADVQREAERLMRGRTGAVVAIEPRTGKVRALVSAPRDAALNRALNGLYPPGSTFKVFVAAAAMDAGLRPVYDCPPGGWRCSPGTPPIRDSGALAAARAGKAWKGYGKIGMAEALAKSSNVYFAKLGAALGPERFEAAVAKARLRDGAVLLESGDADLAAAGCSVPYGIGRGAMAYAGIGQGELLCTPLGVALVAAGVANGGAIAEPVLLEEGKSRLRAELCSPRAAKAVGQMMRLAVRSGTGRGCDLPGLGVCGKTGTAQTGAGKDHSWFACYAPAGNPRLAVAVVVERGGFGAEAALPVARGVLEAAGKAGLLR